MPNGRSGGFVLKTFEFDQLLKKLDGDIVVGSRHSEPVTASELKRLSCNSTGDGVPIEEQDGSWYIVKFVNAGDWVIVGGESPLYQDLRSAHVDYVRKNHGSRMSRYGLLGAIGKWIGARRQENE